jgi:hypothetical protein
MWHRTCSKQPPQSPQPLQPRPRRPPPPHPVVQAPPDPAARTRARVRQTGRAPRPPAGAPRAPRHPMPLAPTDPGHHSGAAALAGPPPRQRPLPSHRESPRPATRAEAAVQRMRWRSPLRSRDGAAGQRSSPGRVASQPGPRPAPPRPRAPGPGALGSRPLLPARSHAPPAPFVGPRPRLAGPGRRGRQGAVGLKLPRWGRGRRAAWARPPPTPRHTSPPSAPGQGQGVGLPTLGPPPCHSPRPRPWVHWTWTGLGTRWRG